MLNSDFDHMFGLVTKFCDQKSERSKLNWPIGIVQVLPSKTWWNIGSHWILFERVLVFKEKKQILLNDFQLIELFRNTIQNDEDFQVLIDYYKPDFHIFDYTIPQL